MLASSLYFLANPLFGTIIGLLPLVLLLACGHAPAGGELVPEREFLLAYAGWGDQLQYERSDDFAWNDGSSWLDGVSSTPPPLPIPAGDPPSSVMTCAQEEVINMVAFPDGQGPHEWPQELTLTADQEARQWKANFSRIIWGEDYRQAGEWQAKDPFDKRCIPNP